jgi:hypothetical protein
MNRVAIKAYIKAYKEFFDEINQQEIYKWKAVKHFQEHFNLDAEDFASNLEEALAKTANLLAAANYLPKNLLIDNAKKSPEAVRSLFADLYSIEVSNNPKNWVENFIEGFRTVSESNFPGLSHYQDHRAVMVYLNLQFPDRYFFYKYEIAKGFSSRIDFPGYIKKGDVGNIGVFNEMARQVLTEVEKDQELISLHEKRYSSETYRDISLHILTQDIIYAAVRHLPKLQIDATEGFKVLAVDEEYNPVVNGLKRQPGSKGVKVDYVAKQRSNTHLGKAGEIWVMKFEEAFLKNNGKEKWLKEIRHVSETDGDGLGYDILSKNLDGSPKYIEVKTTKGEKDTDFFITENEMNCSKIEKANYFLYRVYDFNPEIMHGRLAIRRGELTDLCTRPVVFKV